MDILDFYDKVNNHEKLFGKGIGKSPDGKECLLCVGYRDEPEVTKFGITREMVEAHKWEDLEDIMLLRSDGRNLRHMSRVVGYYSFLDAWNPSKIGENRDRQKGNYAIGAMNGS